MVYFIFSIYKWGPPTAYTVSGVTYYFGILDFTIPTVVNLVNVKEFVASWDPSNIESFVILDATHFYYAGYTLQFFYNNLSPFLTPIAAP